MEARIGVLKCKGGVQEGIWGRVNKSKGALKSLI